MFGASGSSSMVEPLKFLQEVPQKIQKDLKDLANSFPPVGHDWSSPPHPSTIPRLGSFGSLGGSDPSKRVDKFTLAWAIAEGWNGKEWEKRWSELKRPDKPRVLILMSETGGGHKASARSIADALEELAPGQLSIHIVDVFVEHAGFPFNRFPKMYQWFASKPTLWDGVYRTAKMTAGSVAGWEEPLALAWDADFQKCVQQENPDIIVSVHPLCQDPTCRVVRRIAGWKAGRKVPFVTCVTDLGEGHPFWFHPEVNLCFVPGQAVKKDGLTYGLKEEQLRMHGLPVRKGFWGVDTSIENKKRLRAKLGIADCRTVLVVGGGDGMGDLLGVSLAVGRAVPSETEVRNVVIVCGTNEEVYKKLCKEKWDQAVHMHIQKFVSNMDEWMIASDIIVTKAGPGTIAEATIVGLPIMLSGFLPGQEEANKNFVVDGHMGEFRSDPKELGQRVCAWLDNPNLLQQLSDNSKAAGRPTSSLEIAKDILETMAAHARPVPAEDSAKSTSPKSTSPEPASVGFVLTTSEVKELASQISAEDDGLVSRDGPASSSALGETS